MNSELSLVADLRSIKEKVVAVLASNPSARNSDEVLYAAYRERFGPAKTQESLRRLRQVIQNKDGRYLPTDLRVLIARQSKSQAMRKAVVQV